MDGSAARVSNVQGPRYANMDGSAARVSDVEGPRSANMDGNGQFDPDEFTEMIVKLYHDKKGDAGEARKQNMFCRLPCHWDWE